MSRHVNLEEYESDFGGINRLKEKLRDSLGSLLFLPTKEEIISHSLELFESFEIDKGDKNSIIKGCEIVLKYFEIDWIQDPNPIDIYFEEILGLFNLPNDNLNHLEFSVKTDLRYLDTVISKYQENDYVKAYINENRLPQNHEGRIQIDFYKRCTSQRDVVLKYLLNGLHKRALLKASIGYDRPWIEIINQSYQDRPYKLSSLYYLEYFEYDKINTYRHRLYDLPIGEGRALGKLFKQGNISEFYSQLEKSLPAKNVFQTLLFMTGRNPVLNNRKDIFQELKMLWDNQYWYGFYALAIPQVEGIFSDMCNILELKKNTDSLSNKVESIRGNADPVFSYDYFQYVLPILRNKFAHSGKDTDIKIKCYHLLYDLKEVVLILDQLEHPFIKLNKILEQAKSESINGVAPWVHIFKLIDLIKKNSQYHQIEEKIKTFLDVSLSHENLENFISELELDLPSRISELENSILAYTETHLNQSVIISSISKREFKKISLQFKEALIDKGFKHHHDLEKVFYIAIFLENYKSYLTHINNASLDRLNNLESANKDVLDKVKSLVDMHKINFEDIRIVNEI